MASPALDKKALWRDIEREARKKRRSVRAELAARLRAARADHKSKRDELLASCKAHREKARERSKANAKAIEGLRAAGRHERAAARGTCDAGAATIGEVKREVAGARGKLAAEVKAQRELREIEALARRGKKDERAAKEARSESDDEVRGNIPSDLVPLFNRIKKGIAASARMSRTEAFLKYVEEHPAEALEGSEAASDALIAELERRQREMTDEEYREAKGNPSAGELVELGKLTKLVARDAATGRQRVMRWGLRKAPILAYDAHAPRANMLIVYPVGRRGQASAAAVHEYARTHWGKSGKGSRVDGLRALAPLATIGPAIQIVYTTEKGGDAAPTDYEHDFGEGSRGAWTPPAVVEHACKAKKCDAAGMVALRGGSYRVTDRGIVG